MSSPILTEQETIWLQQRAQLYQELYKGGETLDRDHVRKIRHHFTTRRTQLESKPYVFPSDTDGVGLVCAPLCREMAQQCHVIGTRLTNLLPREPETHRPVACVTPLDLMHVTLFHTSHPKDLAPDAKLRFSQDKVQLRNMCRQLAPFRLSPHRVLLASSGAIIILFDGVAAPYPLPPNVVINTQAKFSVDQIRHLAKQTFSYVPKIDTHVIIHATLARVVSPEISDEALGTLRATCDEITTELTNARQLVRIEKVWFVEETHHLSPRGPKTEMHLCGGIEKECT
ncbi:hypothetical protein PsorP6_014555 [Peronosclerospora sorghi]|uniref:Uncharacterized protein n=1 Tax=Peronosclerospora sorghi TaxID=230839 RepID=A0ACC0VRY3_9STRA|nr:hypothetical protein PsorP6_014555 [Peronosclerospora sorghi]